MNRHEVFTDERAQSLRNAAQALFACVQRMAEESTNAVLQVLGEKGEICEGRRYPQPPLGFADGHWRAYYHCHALATATAGEHGHFHIFSDGDQRGPDQWSHVAGLAMDLEGQPLRWFVTNRWVTAGSWGRRDVLRVRLECLQPAAGNSLLTQWLTAMLCLYAADIDERLRARDDRLQCARQNGSMEQVLADRSLYELAETRIDLVGTLQRLLSS